MSARRESLVGFPLEHPLVEVKGDADLIKLVISTLMKALLLSLGRRAIHVGLNAAGIAEELQCWIVPPTSGVCTAPAEGH